MKRKNHADDNSVIEYLITAISSLNNAMKSLSKEEEDRKQNSPLALNICATMVSVWMALNRLDHNFDEKWLDQMFPTKDKKRKKKKG